MDSPPPKRSRLNDYVDVREILPPLESLYISPPPVVPTASTLSNTTERLEEDSVMQDNPTTPSNPTEIGPKEDSVMQDTPTTPPNATESGPQEDEVMQDKPSSKENSPARKPAENLAEKPAKPIMKPATPLMAPANKPVRKIIKKLIEPEAAAKKRTRELAEKPADTEPSCWEPLYTWRDNPSDQDGCLMEQGEKIHGSITPPESVFEAAEENNRELEKILRDMDKLRKLGHQTRELITQLDKKLEKQQEKITELMKATEFNARGEVDRHTKTVLLRAAEAEDVCVRAEESVSRVKRVMARINSDTYNHTEKEAKEYKVRWARYEETYGDPLFDGSPYGEEG